MIGTSIKGFPSSPTVVSANEQQKSYFHRMPAPVVIGQELMQPTLSSPIIAPINSQFFTGFQIQVKPQ
jgi:hypothetical protein